MKTMLAVLVVLAGSVVGAAADVMMVTRDGRMTWATDARKQGDQWVYLDRDSGEEKKAAIAEADAVPALQRGVTYKPEEVQLNIDLIKKLREKHKSLLRPLNEILQPWEALQKPSVELDGQITALVNEFQSSDRGTKVFKKVTLDLSMLKYKDMAGAYGAKIDGHVEGIRKEYVATNLVRLTRMTGADKPTAEGFVAIRDLAKPLGEAAEAADRDRIKAMVAKSRLASFEAGCRQAEGGFAQGKSIEAYLRSSALLFLVRREIAETDEQKALVEKKLAALRQAAGRTLSTYRMDGDGFPLMPEDEKLLVATRSFTRPVKFTAGSIPLEEQCQVIPAKSPGPIRLHQPFSLPVRLVFCCAQPTNRVYGMVVMLTGRQGMGEHTVRLPATQIRNGRAEVTFREDFSGVDKSFELGRDKRGDTSLYVYLAYLDEKPDAVQEQWNAISPAWMFPISP